MASCEHQHTLSVRNISASYRDTEILTDATLSIHSGEVVCLTGPNGSGKSTLMTILAGIIPESLSIASRDSYPEFDGRKLSDIKRKECACHIAYMVQDEQSAWDYTVRDVILTGRYAHTASGIYMKNDYAVAENVVSMLHLEQLADRHIKSLSGGEMQKVRIARALAQEPDILLLDEPIANLDFSYQAELLSVIVQLAHCNKLGILLSIHDINTAARFADTMALLPRNKPCITGKPAEVITPANLSAAYGADFGIFTHPVYGCPQAYSIR